MAVLLLLPPTLNPPTHLCSLLQDASICGRAQTLEQCAAASDIAAQLGRRVEGVPAPDTWPSVLRRVLRMLKEAGDVDWVPPDLATAPYCPRNAWHPYTSQYPLYPQ